MPYNTVLDNFNRADSSTLGANWSTPFEIGNGSLGISSHQVIGAAAAFAQSYWNVTRFASNQEAFVSIPVVPLVGSYVAIFMRINSPNTTSVSFYSSYVERLAGNWQVGFAYLTAGGTYTVAKTTAISDVLSGAVFRATVVDGIVSAYINDTLLDTWNGWASASTTITGGGFIGLELNTGDTTTRLDDFGGGNVPIMTSVSIARRIQ